MQNVIKILFSISSLILFTTCKEIGPSVDFTDRNIATDSNYIFQGNLPEAQPKIILLEEFTGVRCVACPTAHQIIRTIELAHPNKIVAVGIHTGFQATPFTGRPDYRIAEGAAIESLLGGVQGYPQGAVNRVLFAQEPRINTAPGKWEGYVSQQLLQTVLVNLNGVSTYNPATRELSISIRSHALASILDEIFLTVGLVESKIIDWQTTPNGIDEMYEHDHILRAMLTPASGILQANNLVPNQVIVKKFTYKLPENLKPENTKWYAALHYLGAKNDVLQTTYGNIN